ncbi:MAG: hypothetical protein LZF62_380179 [Nitrospira sp.]|nr:MAG: hypothetical protein LZF62_380179 [Nitrospira sp.]
MPMMYAAPEGREILGPTLARIGTPTAKAIGAFRHTTKTDVT